jgi:hypothetical protein
MPLEEREQHRRGVDLARRDLEDVLVGHDEVRQLADLDGPTSSSRDALGAARSVAVLRANCSVAFVEMTG